MSNTGVGPIFWIGSISSAVGSLPREVKSGQEWTTEDQAGDEAAVRALEAAYDTAWQGGDIEALVACLAEDAVVINPHGTIAKGRPEIRRVLGEFLSGPARGSRHPSVVSRVEFVTEDVAIVDGETTLDDPAAPSLSTASSLTHRFTDVAVRKNGAWAIAHVRVPQGGRVASGA